ncbi:hypothetical protein [Gracilibacillus kekensis]|uniref:TM2 domain-containing protein n=1 Tax=Gracilibacillus kekensis TaxID=1027249 RepID=A0A1M7PMN2_9BACI|nr:hypothetical protein [Gracilibacillus kekensis]SHN18506.1 hypothetical protein SAMN05216179_2353 [Gracilibacillus kekensis]
MKSPILAFFLAIFPGFGHLYLGFKVRGVLYPFFFIGVLGLAFITGVLVYSDTIFLFFFAVAALIWIVNMIDIVLTLITRSNIDSKLKQADSSEEKLQQNERFSTILLSLIPGVGHFYLGLTHRGLTIVTAFFGIITMVFFVSFITSAVFLIFLLALPIIWVYSMFDAIQLLNKKQIGDPVKDKTIMDDFDDFREEGKKSKMLATALSIFPGAGHMYLGLQKRGLQLMVAFLLSIYILDVLNLSIFLFLIPIIWFFSFFDALQLANKLEYEIVDDVPVIKYLVNQQKWIGIGLLVLGFFYLFDAVLLPTMADTIRELFNVDIWHYYHQYFQVTIVALLLIGGGFKLIIGSKKPRRRM